MAEQSNQPNKGPNTVEEIVATGKRAFDPGHDEKSRETGRRDYNELLEKTDTWTLLHALNALIQPDATPPWLRQPLMESLTLIPLRKDGVRATMELVFMVHPSSGKPSDTKDPQKQGASITHEAVAVATKLLSSVPEGMTANEWFQGISEQIFSLLDGEVGPDLARTAAQIVGYGILGKRSYGAPGTVGWNAFVQPILEPLNPSLRTASTGEFTTIEQNGVVDLTRGRLMVSSESLQRAISRLKVLIISNPSPGLCKRVLTRVIPQIWILASWKADGDERDKNFKTPAKVLLQTYLRLFGNVDSVKPLIQNIMSKGSADNADPAWELCAVGSSGIEIVAPCGTGSDIIDWVEIENRAGTLVDFISSSCSSEEVSAIFLQLLKKWIQSTEQQKHSSVDISLTDRTTSSTPVTDLVEVTILQKMMEKAPEKLVSHFDQLLELVSQVFTMDRKASLGEDVLGVVLSLLNLVITTPTFQKADIKPEQLQIVEESLNRLSQEDRPDISATARNLSLLLEYRDQLEDPNDATSTISNQHVADRKTYNLAMSYITGDKENPPPIVSEGLNLLSGLIVAQSPILDITAVTVLMSNLLKDNEDYINLRVVKIFTLLANKHPKSTLRELLDNYLDSQEKLTTDTRLRFGEALLQVIEKIGQLFTGEAAQHTAETLLSIAGRRVHRAKAFAKQERDERLRKMKERKQKPGDADDDDDDDDQDMDEGGEELLEEDKAKNDMLTQIIQGWESKRGSEDIRIRTSALSIFGSSLEVNIRGIGPSLVSAGVDMCLNILALEPGIETGILRRAAIIVILSFVRALSDAKESGVSLGFGLADQSRADIQRTLEYVAATDSDGLVQQHARDVVESFENWQMSSLIPQAQETTSVGLTGLAGLHVNTGIQGNGPRPRIEEIE